MKPTNLYDIYRGVKARGSNKNKSSITQQLCERMIEAAESIVDKKTLTKVKEFRKAEKEWLEAGDVSAHITFADRFEKAIRSKNFISERSHFNPKAKHSQVRFGVVYCVKATANSQQLKLGWSGDMRTRLQKLKGRYNLSPEPFFAISTDYPAKIEFDAKKKFRNFLVAGNTCGESNEWYQITAIAFARLIVETIVDYGHLHLIKRITIYSGCANQNNVSIVLSQLGVPISREKWF